MNCTSDSPSRPSLRPNRSRVVSIAGNASLLALLLLTGCTKELVRISEPVGPAPAVRPTPNVGRLIVATEEIPPYSDETYTRHEPYTISDPSGRVVKEVSNESGGDVVELESGRYTVHAPGLQLRVTTVDVQIVPGMTTEVHLDGNWFPKERGDSASVVTSPGGQPVGYRFAPATTPSASGSPLGDSTRTSAR